MNKVLSGNMGWMGAFLLIALASCSGIRQNILFQTDGEINPEAFGYSYETAVKNYVIEPYDIIAISVYTNNGERLIDPNAEFEIGDAAGGNIGGQGNVGLQQMGQGGGNATNGFLNYSIMSNNTPPRNYRVNADGRATIPMIGEVGLAGLTLEEADSVLAERFSAYYEGPYVISQYLNKRVVLMGALGDQVIPLRNERMTLLEVLSLAGDVQVRAKPDKIRIIRGDLQNPSVQLVDLTTIASLKEANLIVQPNDIIYVEPRRRLDRESIADFNTLLSPLTAIASTVVAVILLIDAFKP